MESFKISSEISGSIRREIRLKQCEADEQFGEYKIKSEKKRILKVLELIVNNC